VFIYKVFLLSGEGGWSDKIKIKNIGADNQQEGGQQRLLVAPHVAFPKIPLTFASTNSAGWSSW
jgi:hypothetical protein